MSAPLKLTSRRETRLLELVALGANVTEAARAVQLSRWTVSRHAQQDPVFAARLDAARELATSANSQTDPAPDDDWLAAAKFLESEHPDRWALPDLPLDVGVG
ncbi:MAG TPA: hypothetical protein VHY83_04215 [Solirubrobacteraceae bacterium]|nr:hypothetical protein [Solirubrobacteraceae bacterium]